MKNPHVAFFTLFALACLSTDANAQTWTRRPGTDHWYRRDTNFQPQPWHVSNSATQGATLATFETLGENEWVTGSVGEGDGDWAWIGLYQDVDDDYYEEPGGGWKWWGGASINYTNWGRGDPDDHGGPAYQQHAVADRANETVWGDAEAVRPFEAIYEIVSGDCNGNWVPDVYELTAGHGRDTNNNGVIDECELILPGLNGWTRRAGTNDWYIQTSDYTWDYGRTLALNAGADLAVIESADELNWCISYNGSSYSFIGLYQDYSAPDFSEPGGGWTWVDPSNTFLSWESTQPDRLVVENHGAFLGDGIHDSDGAVPRTCLFEINSIDCDGNGVPDAYEIARDPSLDLDLDEVLDSCGSFSVELVITSEEQGITSACVADLDGDGDPDVVAPGRESHDVSWYENLGAGDFGERQVITSNWGSPRSIRAADLDGDGDLDLLTASYDTTGLQWIENRLNESTADFATPPGIVYNVDGFVDVFAADIDGDGLPDVLAANHSADKVTWYRNLGGSSSDQFGNEQTVTTAADGVQSIFAVDLNGDGTVDVLSASKEGDQIAWYENLGGTFGVQNVISSQTLNAHSVHAADLDGDGDADVLSASRVDDKVVWYENRLNEVRADFSQEKMLSGPLNTPTDAQSANYVFAVDLNGDGDMDVLSSSDGDGKVAWYENLGLGTFADQRVISILNDPWWVSAADIDGDGDPDILSTSDGDDKVVWYANLILIDCNGNGAADTGDIASGFSLDCDSNGVPDECEYEDCDFDGVSDNCAVANGDEPDCNSNDVPDWCDVAYATSEDCQPNGIPDECEQDCDANGIPDDCDPSVPDCDSDGLPDGCEADCNLNSTPDDCEPDGNDCNASGVPDDCELVDNDCNRNNLPDECDTDCNSDGTPDDCQTLADCNSDGIPDECQPFGDCNSDGTPDECQLENNDCNDDLVPDDCQLDGNDCNENDIPDDCDTATLDCNSDGVPDDCQLDGNDCDTNGVPDDCQLDGNDCNASGVPDQCELDGNDCNDNSIPDDCDAATLDCNSDSVPDDCQLDGNDCDTNGVPDECDPDCNADGGPDACDPDCNNNGVSDSCDTLPGGDSDDVNSNSIPDECECFASWFCSTSPNSVGAGVLIDYDGTLSVGLNNLSFKVSGGIPGQPGLFYYGANQLNNGDGITFGQGLRCVGGQVFRIEPPVFMDSAGEAAKPIDLTAGPMGSGDGPVMPGSVYNFQFWYRDPTAGAPGFNFNLSDAMQLTFCP